MAERLRDEKFRPAAGLSNFFEIRKPAFCELAPVALKRHHTKGLLEAGCDEAGRGCLAGPVFAAAVILPERCRLPFLNDSKQLSAETRNALRPLIERKAIAWAVARVDHDEIDRINILRASFKAMHLAIAALKERPQQLLIDGNRFTRYEDIPHCCIIGGDGLYASIAAASILAKTHRDEYMQQLHAAHPQYGWQENKGYGTRAHREAIAAHGLSPYHRRSFSMGPELQPGVLFEEAVSPDGEAQSAALP
jgi:ribonuclease HII